MTRTYAVAGWLLASGSSGANQRLRALLHALPALLEPDEHIVVLHAPVPGSAPAPIQHERVRFHAVAIPPQPTWRRVLDERRVLPRVLAELGASLLHLESLPVPRVPCPVALTVHDLRDLTPYRRRSRWLFARALTHGVARAAALIAPSRFTADALRAHGVTRAVTIVPGTLDPAWCAGAATQPPWPSLFMHVGHLEPRKDLATLLRAYACAASASALPPLVLAGRDAGSGGALRQLAAQLGIADRVHFLGAIDDSTLRGLYRAARAVLVPSRYEGFGLPALEALTFARPVIVSDAGALPEVVGNAGVIVPAGDVAAWSAALVRTATTDDTIMAAIRSHVLARYAPARVASELLAAWRTVGATPGTRA